MGRRSFSRRRNREAPDLDITTFLNLMVVLVPFLLISAVFSRVTVMELSVPTAAGGAAPTPNFAVEVIVRQSGLELANGARVVDRIPREAEEAYDLGTLSRKLIALKERYPEKEDATVLMEPEIEYDHLIHVMDTVREAEIRQEGSDEVGKMALFPQISIGDAP